MIRAAGLGYRVHGAVLVEGIDLEVRPGELLALVGSNGAGKSTLLRLLAGELVPTRGSVTLDGMPLAALGSLALARRRAVLPQGLPSTPGLTAGEVTALGRAPHRGLASPEENRQAWAQALDAVGMTTRSERRMETLSGGEAQRVHFARGLAQVTGREPESRFYFLDEPTSALDLGRQLEILGRLRTLAAEGLGVVAVVHDLNLAARFADRLAVLHRGRLAASGPPGSVLTEDLVRTAFGVRSLVWAHPVLGHPLVLPLETTP